MFMKDDEETNIYPGEELWFPEWVNENSFRTILVHDDGRVEEDRAENVF